MRAKRLRCTRSVEAKDSPLLPLLQWWQKRWSSRSNLRAFQPGRIVSLMLLLLASLCPTTPQVSAAIQPALFALATAHPDTTVTVIVQGWGQSLAGEQAVTAFGGQVVRDLSIIHAFVAQLPARAVMQLGQIAGVRRISLDSPVQSTFCFWCIDTSRLVSAYIRTIGANKVWNRPPYLQGQGIAIAVVDSGINFQTDLDGSRRFTHRLIAKAVFNGSPSGEDAYGHGDHVTRIIGSNGGRTGEYIGVAPEANLINVKVANETGSAKISDVIGGLQWIYQNQAKYNIRVVNLSMNDSVLESYHTSALDAAVEVLWFNGIVVVVSAGNTGAGGIYAPANDPFVITVGATDDRGTPDPADDVLAPFSTYGTTLDGFPKPDLVAPGTNIVSKLKNANQMLVKEHPNNIVQVSRNGSVYFRMSGTSMAAPMVAGAAALLIQSKPSLTPDQVKYRLMYTARPFATAAQAGGGYLDIDAAVQGGSTEKENLGLEISSLLWSNSIPITWDLLTQLSVNWRGNGAAFWGSVSRNGDVGNSAIWGSDYWDNVQSAQLNLGVADESSAEAEETSPSEVISVTPDDTSLNQRSFLPLIISNTP